MTQTNIFDEKITEIIRKRSASHWHKASGLFAYFAEDIADRVDSTLRTYAHALDFGARLNYVSQALAASNKVKHWAIQECVAPPNLTANIDYLGNNPSFAPDSYDLITSLLNLHQYNQMETHLQIYHHLLKAGGLFVANFFGGQSFKELRSASYAAEMEVLGGTSPRVAPMIELDDAGNMLYAAGFKIPVADTDIITLNYQSPKQFLYELKYMGQSNNLSERLKITGKPRAYLQALEHHLQKIAGIDDGSINITCEIITLTGFKDDGTMSPKTHQGRVIKPSEEI